LRVPPISCAREESPTGLKNGKKESKYGACLPSAAPEESPTGLKNWKKERKKENMARASHQLRTGESTTGLDCCANEALSY
jgi:hypothetical protein